MDLDSLNGTFVNNQPVKERILRHGDRIEVGDSHFVFLLEEEDAAAKIPEVSETSDGALAGAARVLGLQRTYLHRVMRNLQIKSDE